MAKRSGSSRRRANWPLGLPCFGPLGMLLCRRSQCIPFSSSSNCPGQENVPSRPSWTQSWRRSWRLITSCLDRDDLSSGLVGPRQLASQLVGLIFNMLPRQVGCPPCVCDLESDCRQAQPDVRLSCPSRKQGLGQTFRIVLGLYCCQSCSAALTRRRSE